MFLTLTCVCHPVHTVFYGFDWISNRIIFVLIFAIVFIEQLLLPLHVDLRVNKMLRVVLCALALHCCLAQQYQGKVAPGVPPQQYQQQQYQPPPPQHHQAPVQPQFQQPPQGYQQPPQGYQQQQPPPQQVQQQQPHAQPQQPHAQPQQPHAQQRQHAPHAHQGDPQLLNTANINKERDHIQEHMEVPIDTSKMSEQELQFHYFKMHDADNNNKLDGCELIKSLIHWHGGDDDANGAAKPIYSDESLTKLVEMAFKSADANDDGFIDYAEYRAETTNKI